MAAVPLAGAQFSDFEPVSKIGSGSFGNVSLVRHKPSGALFACKQMSKRKIIALRQVEHVNNERAILSTVTSPFIVRQHACFQDAANLYLVMDFVQGGELFFYLRKYTKFPTEVVKFYAAELVLALDYLHQKSTIYRDLKPENVLLDKTGHIKLTDLGFARHLQGAMAFTLCGTPEYMAPEIIKQTGHDKAVDWWALGILIYEMLCGYPPFYDETPDAVCKKILAGKISFPKSVDKVSVDLILRLLNPDKNKRLGSAPQNGAADIKRHPFFNGVNWGMFERRMIRPPIIPKVSSVADTKNYADCQDEEDAFDYETIGDRGVEAGLAPVPTSQEEVDKVFVQFSQGPGASEEVEKAV